MREYLIRPEDRAEWIPVHVDDMTRVFTPAGWNAIAIAGCGENRFRIDDAEIYFSGEDVGWHVSVEGSVEPATADAIVDRVAKQLAEYSGGPTKWTCL